MRQKLDPDSPAPVLGIRLPASLRRKIEQVAWSRHMTASQYVREILEREHPAPSNDDQAKTAKRRTLLSPEQRSERARLAAHAMWARVRRIEVPDGEHLRKAEMARQAYDEAKAAVATEAPS